MNIIKIVSSNVFKQNSYLIESDNTLILIDCGSSVNEVKERYKKATNSSLMPKIDAIVLTHTHFDHILFLEEFEKEYSCPIYVKQNCKKYISSPKFNASNILDKPLSYNPQNIIEFNETPIIVNGITLFPILTPGHSLCSTCFLIEDNLFTGDTIFYLSVGRTDLTGGDSTKLRQSINIIKTLNFSTCYPGHGVSFNKEDIHI